MVVYVNGSYRALHKIMTGKEYESGAPQLKWNMLLDRLKQRITYKGAFGYHNVAVGYYMVKNPSSDNLYDIFFTIVSTHIEYDIANKIIAGPIDIVLDSAFKEIKPEIYEEMKFNDPDFDIGNIYFFDSGRLNGFSDDGLNVFVQLSEGSGVDDPFRSFNMSVEFGSYFGSYKLETEYNCDVLYNTILGDVGGKRQAMINIALNLIKNYILNLILVNKINESCDQDNIIY